MPIKYQRYLHIWEENKVTLYKYWNALTNNTIHIATDGSHVSETTLGAGAAVMTNMTDTEDMNISVGAKCCAIDGMTSLTAKQTGLISALLLLHMMCLRYGTPTRKCLIHVWIDNEEALRRITTTKEDDIRLKAYGVRDYGPRHHEESTPPTTTYY